MHPWHPFYIRDCTKGVLKKTTTCIMHLFCFCLVPPTPYVATVSLSLSSSPQVQHQGRWWSHLPRAVRWKRRRHPGGFELRGLVPLKCWICRGNIAPRTQMTLVLIGKGIFFGGALTFNKLGVIGALGAYIPSRSLTVRSWKVKLRK